MQTSQRTVSKNVQLMITCLCDAFYAEAAQAAVLVLEHAGCTVSVPDAQTCCGQPAFNAGDWKATRKVVRHTLRTFHGDQSIILPSGSCAHMVAEGYDLAFEHETDRGEALKLASRTWELCDFLVNGLGIRKWPGRLETTLTVHRSCHSRGSESHAAALTLLGSIEGVRILEFDEPEQCCGFGGTFSVAYPNTSIEMGALKLKNLLKPAPQYVGTLDLACMMHVSGIAGHRSIPLTVKHVAELLMMALESESTPTRTAEERADTHNRPSERP